MPVRPEHQRGGISSSIEYFDVVPDLRLIGHPSAGPSRTPAWWPFELHGRFVRGARATLVILTWCPTYACQHFCCQADIFTWYLPPTGHI